MSEKQINPPVLNFWVGMAAILGLILALGGLLFLGGQLL